MPATTVQKLAAAAWSDGWGVANDVASRLAGLGSDGTYPGNCLRDLLRMSKDIGIGSSTPEPYMVSVKTSGGGYRNVGVFLPHEEIAMSVQMHGIDALRLSTAAWDSGIGLGAMLRDWGDSPHIQLEARDVIAIGLHADGVSYSASQRAGSTRSVLAAAWNAISADLPANRGRRHLFFALSKALCCQCGCEGLMCLMLWDGFSSPPVSPLSLAFAAQAAASDFIDTIGQRSTRQRHPPITDTSRTLHVRPIVQGFCLEYDVSQGRPNPESEARRHRVDSPRQQASTSCRHPPPSCTRAGSR